MYDDLIFNDPYFDDDIYDDMVTDADLDADLDLARAVNKRLSIGSYNKYSKKSQAIKNLDLYLD